MSMPTFPPCVTDITQEQALNKSIICLLDSVLQNQMILNGKLERVLCAKETCPPHCKGSIRLACAAGHLHWRNNCRLPWVCREQLGEELHLRARDNTLLELRPARQYRLDYAFTLRALSAASGTGTLVPHTISDGACTALQPHRFATDALLKHPQTITGSILLFPYPCAERCRCVAFSLTCTDRILVEQASLSVSEL